MRSGDASVVVAGLRVAFVLLLALLPRQRDETLTLQQQG